MNKSPDWVSAMWDLYWYYFYGTPRKVTIRRMIEHGLTARQAIGEIRDFERKEG